MCQSPQTCLYTWLAISCVLLWDLCVGVGIIFFILFLSFFFLLIFFCFGLSVCLNSSSSSLIFSVFVSFLLFFSCFKYHSLFFCFVFLVFLPYFPSSLSLSSFFSDSSLITHCTDMSVKPEVCIHRGRPHIDTSLYLSSLADKKDDQLVAQYSIQDQEGREPGEPSCCLQDGCICLRWVFTSSKMREKP